LAPLLASASEVGRLIRGPTIYVYMKYMHIARARRLPTLAKLRPN